MKIYISHSTKYDYLNELYLPIKKTDFNKAYQFIFPHEKSKEKLFNSKKLFYEGCDLVLAEISYPSISIGIELGWANMLGIKIICLYKKGIKPSKSLIKLFLQCLFHIKTLKN
ncbi:MAG: hypothetical protein N2593_03555 [Patescibacteria group bacterium]|nr:hypothetical protein [Patescibacteria group bacterium]